MEDPNETIPEAEAQRPEWLPDNFQTPEDLAKSYTEANSKLGQLGSKAAEAERRAAEAEQRLQALEAQYAQQAQPDDSQVEWLNEQFETRPLETMAWLAQQAATTAVQQYQQSQTPSNNHEVVAFAADQALASKHEDWGDYREKIAAAVQADPGLFADVSDTTPLAGVQRALERVYKVVKAEAVLDQGATFAQQAEAQRLAKQQAQTLSGASGRPEADASGADAARAAILRAAQGGDYATLRGRV